jgi:hypothetical protein
MIIVENSATEREHPLRRRIEMIRMEVFLDFDPVFPGWPPTSATERRPQQQLKRVADGGQDHHQPKRLSAVAGNKSSSATALTLEILRELADA